MQCLFLLDQHPALEGLEQDGRVIWSERQGEVRQDIKICQIISHHGRKGLGFSFSSEICRNFYAFLMTTGQGPKICPDFPSLFPMHAPTVDLEKDFYGGKMCCCMQHGCAIEVEREKPPRESPKPLANSISPTVLLEMRFQPETDNHLRGLWIVPGSHLAKHRFQILRRWL